MGLMGVVGPEIAAIKTMKLEGRLSGVLIVVLVDNGSSHNFVAPQVVSTLNITVDSSKGFGVRLGDGHRISTKGKRTGLPIQLGENNIVVDAYVLDLGGVDMILGVAWLETLGKVEMDWKGMFMIFKLGIETVKLEGVRELLSKEDSRNRSEFSAILFSSGIHGFIY